MTTDGLSFPLIISLQNRKELNFRQLKQRNIRLLDING